jgi:hypothetical protein
MDELELTDEMLERNDDIDNAVFGCLCALAEKELEWDMELIGEATDVLKDILKDRGFPVRHPGVVTEPDGTQHYEEYD